MRVRDASGAGIANAIVTLSREELSSSDLFSSATGDTIFDNLTYGQYRLTEEVSGYKSNSQLIDIPYAGNEITVVLEEDKLVSIPGGTFQLGQTGVATPVHQVNLSPFVMGKYEVTNTEYVAFLNDMGNQEEPSGGNSWIDIVANDLQGITG